MCRPTARKRFGSIIRAYGFLKELKGGLVLLSSFREACIRAGEPGLPRQQLVKQREVMRYVQVNRPQAFGGTIRAHGFLKVLLGAWELWQEMRSRSILPPRIDSCWAATQYYGMAAAA